MKNGVFERRVTVPEPLALVRRADAGTEESALVVAELPVDRIDYFLALVDGERFAEHALVRGEAWVERAELRSLCRRILTLKRPRLVSFARFPDEGACRLVELDGDEAGATALAAIVDERPKAGPAEVIGPSGAWSVELARDKLIWLARVTPSAAAT